MAGVVTLPTIVPAAPGWSVALYDEGAFRFEPILAWGITALPPGGYDHAGENDYIVDPITVDGNANGFAQPKAIRRPDGEFEIPGDRTCANEAAALAYLREREASDRRAKGAR